MRVLVLLLLACCGVPAAAAEEALLRNGTFATWAAEGPEGWQTSVGAERGEGAPSGLRRDPAGGLVLEGGADTRVWRYVAQSFVPRPGACYRLTFTARAEGLRMDPGQFGSCYVGVAFRGARGQVLLREVADVRSATPRTERLYVKVPSDAARAEVGIFLSQTGRLTVGSVGLAALSPADSYDVLVDDMGRHYSFLAAHAIDWPALTAAHAEAGRRARTPAAFVAAVRPLLAALEDLHVQIVTPDGEPVATHQPDGTANFDLPAIVAGLDPWRQIGRTALVGRTRVGGFGYLLLGSLAGGDEVFTAIERELEGMLATPGVIVDLRGNVGGAEVRAQRLVALLADERRVYGRALRRTGPAPTDLGPAGTRHVAPRPGHRHGKPVVCLVGPGCMSSGEGMAMMLRALPHATLVGLPTFGASGNPQPIHLPNGVSVRYSRWVSLLPDGTPIERKGVPPDEVVPQGAEGDAAFARAVEILTARTR